MAKITPISNDDWDGRVMSWFQFHFMLATATTAATGCAALRGNVPLSTKVQYAHISFQREYSLLV